MDVYREVILEHYKDPLHKGHVMRVDEKVHASNPSCGDELDVEFEYDTHSVITDAKFSGTGCAISQASADLVLGEVRGKRKQELSEITKEDVFELLGGPVNPGREKCATLVLKALQNREVKKTLKKVFKY